MENIFLDFFNLSISASWIVLAVLAARLLLKKAPKWIYCVLWSIVGVRLVFPFSLESVFSLLPSRETISHNTLYQMNPTVDTGIEAINNVVNPVFSSAFASVPQNSVNPLQVATIISSYLWITGIAVMLIYTLVTYFRLKGKVKTATLFKENIFQSENVSSPFVLGVIRPKIYLPYNLGERDMNYVIAHEKAHIKRKDHLIKPLAFLILTVYWFNPVMWLAYILLCRDIELACDERVVKDFDRDSCKAYSYALLNCSINRKSIAACPLAFGEVGVKDRVKNILSYKKPAFWVIVIAVILCIVTAVCFLTVPKGVTLEEGYLYEPILSTTDKIVIETPEKTYTFTSKGQIEYIAEYINGITVDKDKTEENPDSQYEKDTDAYITVNGYEGENLTAQRCFNSDFTKLWISKTGMCEFFFFTHEPEEVKTFFASELKNTYLSEQADKLISELLITNYCTAENKNSAEFESHYVVKKELSSADTDEDGIENIKMHLLFRCSEFRYDGYTLTEDYAVSGLGEFTFKVYDGDKVVFDSFSETAQGEEFEIEDYIGGLKISTTEITKELASETRDKAMAHFGIGSDSTEAEESTTDEGITSLSEIDFTYDIVPVLETSRNSVNPKTVEDIVKEKALNSSELIKNSNKQVHPHEYCLIYKEDSSEKLSSDYSMYMDISQSARGLSSFSEVIEKYSASESEKDLYIVYIPRDKNKTDMTYAVSDFAYLDGKITAVITAVPGFEYEKDYSGFLAVICADKSVGTTFDSFNAILKERISIYDGGGEVSLSDITDMNIGAEMPQMIYCEDRTLIMTGTFGLIVFDLVEKKVVDRLEYSLLEKLGISILNAKVSADGSRVYMKNFDGSGKDTHWLYTYYVSTKQLFDYGGEASFDTLYDGLTFWGYDGSADMPEQNYLYGEYLKDSGTDVYFLRAATDWSMKSLHVLHYDRDSGKTEEFDVFR